MPAKGATAETATLGPYFQKGRFCETFAPLPTSILRLALSDAAKLTWARLAQYTSKTDGAFPLIATLMAELGYTRSKVERAIRELKKRGLLEVIGRPGHSNVYRLRLPVSAPNPKKIPSPVKGLPPSPVTYIKDNLLKDQRPGGAAPGDLDTLPANCFRNLQADALSQRLEKYFGEPPKKRLVEDVRAAVRQANGGPVEDRLIVEELDSLEKIYPRGSQKGPRYWSWFPVAVADRFGAARQGREARVLPPAAPAATLAALIPDFLALDED